MSGASPQPFSVQLTAICSTCLGPIRDPCQLDLRDFKGWCAPPNSHKLRIYITYRLLSVWDGMGTFTPLATSWASETGCGGEHSKGLARAGSDVAGPLTCHMKSASWNQAPSSASAPFWSAAMAQAAQTQDHHVSPCFTIAFACRFQRRARGFAARPCPEAGAVCIALLISPPCLSIERLFPALEPHGDRSTW